MPELCNSKECYACFACKNICPVSAISMEEDALGNLFPYVNPKICIHCEQCISVCPAKQESNFHVPQNTYAAIAKDPDDYKRSSSGGIATIFSKQVIARGGVVYGAAILPDLSAVHIRATTLDELELLRGSKYVQSSIGSTFSQVKTDLEAGIEVLFIGTPCQTDGLLHFLKKEFENLTTINLICHGVPSNRLLLEHIHSIPNLANTPNKVAFRNNSQFYFCMYADTTKIYSRPFYSDTYFLGFMRKLFYKNACYSCKYAQKSRVGDLTIGDFWGFDTSKPFVTELRHGCSVVLTNSCQGEHFFQSCKHALIYQQRELDEAVSGNPQLRAPSKRHRNNTRFNKLFLTKGFEKAVNQTLWLEKIGYQFVFRINTIRHKKG